MNDKVLEQIGVTATGGWDWNTKKGCFKQAVPKLENLASVVFVSCVFTILGKTFSVLTTMRKMVLQLPHLDCVDCTLNNKREHDLGKMPPI